MLDEIPAFAIAALNAHGTTIIKDAKELTIKESNRIKTLTTELFKMGANIKPTDDGMIIHGITSRDSPINPLKGNQTLNPHNDHRIAMSLAIAAAALTEPNTQTTITNADCTAISFPNFFDILSRLLSPNII